jgi:gentisate 1,2-dioxygenase
MTTNTLPPPSALAEAESLERLYGLLAPLHIDAGWAKPTPSLWPEPRPELTPAHWRYTEAKAALDAAGRLINTELAERRNLVLINPAEGNGYATTKTLVAAYQMIMPSEKARTHRHTPNALRLILDAAPGAFTTVDGVKLAMEPGDVVLTPNWSWHGHGNDGTANAYWLDFLDVPLVQLLEPMFFESYPGDYQEADASSESSPMRFVWAETRRRLDAAPSGTEIALGDPALDTMALSMIGLCAGDTTPNRRMTANNHYAVVAGTGTTNVDGERFAWQLGDVIAVPAWQPHTHAAVEDAVLFRVSDEPVMSRLGFLRAAD